TPVERPRHFTTNHVQREPHEPNKSCSRRAGTAVRRSTRALCIEQSGATSRREGTLISQQRGARMTADQTTPLVVHVERVLPAPRARIFELHSEADQLAKWWGPKGFTVPNIVVDLRVGGRYRIAM